MSLGHRRGGGAVLALAAALALGGVLLPAAGGADAEAVAPVVGAATVAARDSEPLSGRPSGPAPLAPTLTVTPGRATYGSPAPLDVVVAGGAALSGEVLVLAEGRTLATAPVSAGRARVGVPGLDVGTHRLTVRVAGGAGPSLEQDVTVTVLPAIPRLNLSTTRATYGARATLTVRAVSAATVTGRVRVRVDGSHHATVKLTNGAARVTLPARLAVGRHALAVTYLGSDRFEQASGTISVRVRGVRARIHGFRTGKRTVTAGSTYRDAVHLSHAGVLQKRVKGTWVKVARLPKGAATVTVKAGKAGATARYRIVVKDRSGLQGATTATLTLKSE